MSIAQQLIIGGFLYLLIGVLVSAKLAANSLFSSRETCFKFIHYVTVLWPLVLLTPLAIHVAQFFAEDDDDDEHRENL